MSRSVWYTILGIVCVVAVGMMMYSLNERESPAPEEGAPAPSASASAAPAAPGASGSASPSASPSAPAGQVDEAAATALYKSNCLACHGDQLQGQLGPALNKVGGSMTADQIAAQITNGGGGMPAFKGTLTDAEIQTLTTWLAAMK